MAVVVEILITNKDEIINNSKKKTIQKLRRQKVVRKHKTDEMKHKVPQTSETK